jgi:hypothetical protein
MSVAGEWADGTWHSVTEAGGVTHETISTPDGGYYSRPEAGRWQRNDLSNVPAPPAGALVEAIEVLGGGDEDDTASADSMATTVASMIYVNGEDPSQIAAGGETGTLVPSAMAAPDTLLASIRRLSSSPKLTDDRTVVAVLQAPEKYVEAFGHPIPDGEIELDLGPDDLPTALRLRIEGAPVSLEQEFRFSDWNTPIEIALPSDEETDLTPWINEELLRQIDVEPVVLSMLPEGWVLRGADAMPLSSVRENAPEGCLRVEVEYGAPEIGFDAEAGTFDNEHLPIALMTVECAMAIDARPFDRITRVLPTRRDEEDGVVQLRMADTVVEIDDSLSQPSLEALALALRPADKDAFVAEAIAAAEAFHMR